MKNKTNILIIEDELIIANHLKSNLEEMGYLVSGIVTDYDSAIRFFDENNPDLVLIDIKIDGEQDGIDVAKYLNEKEKNLPFIFLTSYVDAETITKAKVTNPAGYLTKPFTYTSIFSTIEIALYNAKSTIKHQNIVINNGLKQISLPKDEILYIESEHVYSNIVTKSDHYLIRTPISILLSSLPGDSFIRVHRSYIVSIQHIKLITPTHILVEQHKIPIGRTFKDDLHKAMGYNL